MRKLFEGNVGVWVDLGSSWVCKQPAGGVEMFLFVSGTCKKDLVQRALIEAEILTSPLPHVFAQLGLVLGASTLPAGVSTPPK